MDISGTPGDDHLVGTGDPDNFGLTDGGNDTAKGLGGQDFFVFGATYTSHDKVFGGGGNDVVDLTGDYTNAVLKNLTSVETVQVLPGHSYHLTSTDAIVAAGATMEIAASSLGAANSLYFDGTAETDGHFLIFGSVGDDTMKGGTQSDSLIISGGGEDHVYGGAGDDFITAGGALTAADRIDGGDGVDHLTLGGDYSSLLVFKASTLKSVEVISINGQFDYNLRTNDANVAAGATMTLDAHILDASHGIAFDGSHETNGSFQFQGGFGSDRLTGGAKDDDFAGNGGADIMTGGAGADRFDYNMASDSFGSDHDTIVGFDATVDTLHIPFALTASVDTPVTTGKLSSGHFDKDLAKAIGHGELRAHHAVLFTPDTGSLAGHTFLIVDDNGVRGYQANADVVIEFASPVHIASFGIGNFV